MLKTPNLFNRKKELFLISLIIFLAISIRIFILYSSYNNFISKPFYYTDVKILSNYIKIKNGKKYIVLKVKSENLNLIFWTTTYNLYLNLENRIRLKLIISRELTFFNFLNAGYIKTKIKKIYKNSNFSFKEELKDRVSNQHNNYLIKNFYLAIFLATPLSHELRFITSKLGINHLIAISGFHLGILWVVIFFLLNFIYKKFQIIYFPYRFNLIDVGFLTLILLGFYTWFIDSPPSLIRAYFMLILAWIGLILGFRIISFSFLLFISLIILLIFPKLIVNLSFWFSIMGVFYIFLIIKWINIKNIFISLFNISLLIFIFMIPIVHLFFQATSLLQLLSPILSVIFIIFYPLAIFLHIIDFGGMFDELLLQLFNIESLILNLYIDLKYFITYLIISFLSIFYKIFFYILIIFNIIFSIINLYLINFL